MRLTVDLATDVLESVDDLVGRVEDLTPVLRPVSQKMAFAVKQNVPKPSTSAPRRAASTVKRDKYRDMRTYKKSGTVSTGRPADESRPILTLSGGLRDRIEHFYRKDYAAAISKGPHSHFHELGVGGRNNSNPERRFLFISDDLATEIDNDIVTFIVDGETP